VMLRVGLAGYGYWGTNLARAIGSTKNARLCAIADSSNASLEEATSNIKELQTFQLVEDLISSKLIDALIIATPAKSHSDITSKALRAGLHVLVEKPMVMDPEIGIKLREIARSKNLVLMPGHTFIYNDAILWAKEYISSGRLGKILNIYSQRLNLGQLRRDVNVVWNLAPHDIAIFDFLLDSRAKTVSATGSAVTQLGVEDLAFLSLTYNSGVVAHSHVSWLDPNKTRKITIIGTKGMLIIDDTNPGKRIEIHEKFAENIGEGSPSLPKYDISLKSGEISTPTIVFREPLKVEIQDFIDSILNHREPMASSTDGIWVAKVLKAANDSMASSGRSIEVGLLL
jgi:predicted dehydrogenase